MKSILSTSNDLGLFVLRVVLGIVILAHGLQKLLGVFGGHGMLETIEMWKQWWQIPVTITVLVILIESLGAFLLIIGFLGRVMAGLIGIVMAGAVLLVHARWGFYMNWYGLPNTGEGFEYHLLVFAMVAAILINGSGAYSLDRKISQVKNII